MSDAPADPVVSSEAELSPKERRAELRESILTRLAIAIDLAAERLQRAAGGQSVFTNPFDLKATLALLKLAPELLAKFELPPSPFIYDGEGPLIPPCPTCGEGPGAHWPEDCPQRTEANRQNLLKHPHA